MGMFDSVRVINVVHDKFEISHNNNFFQTKDLECRLYEYLIIDNVLYQVSANEPLEKILKIDYSGKLNIYTNTIGICWIEYDFIFNDGVLIDVIPHEIRLLNISAKKPCKPSNVIGVTIDVSNCDFEKKVSFVDSIDDKKLNAIREILGEPTATIIYTKWRNGFTTVASVVQRKEDFYRKG